MKARLVVCVLSLVVFLVLASPLSAGNSAGLKAGVAKIDITPEKPVTMSGYASRKDVSKGVHDPLSIRVLAFEAGGKRLVLVSTDLIGYYDTTEVMREMLRTEFNLQPSEVFLSAIHTHSAPTPTLNKERGHANNVEYTEALKGKLLEVVRQTMGNLEPVSIGTGVGSCPVGVNRRELRIARTGESSIVLGRNPYGVTDKEVLVLKVAKADGALKAVAFDYAVHATCLGPGNYTISGDVLGLAAQCVEKVLGPEVIAPVFAGASGDIDPWFRVLPAFNEEPGWVPEPVLLGTFLGQEVVHVYRAISQTGATDKIATSIVTLQLPTKPPETPTAEKPPATRPFTITAARLGDIAFLGLGGEVGTEIGQAIKAGSPCERTFVITHCNGAGSYLVPKHLHVEKGYEVNTSPYAPQAADIVVREAIRLLHGL